MRTELVLLTTGVLSCFAVAQGGGQQQASQRNKVLTQLQQDEPRAVAHAANAARGLPQRAVTRALRHALYGWAQRDDEHAALVRLFLLDALLQRDAKLPADALLPFLEDPLTEPTTLTLLCSEPLVNERLLLDLFKNRYSPAQGCQENDLRRALLGNVLCLQRAPGFAAHLWQLARLDLSLTVRDGLPSRAQLPGAQIALPRIPVLPRRQDLQEVPSPWTGFPPLPRSQLGMRLQGHDDDGRPVPFRFDPAVLVLTDLPTRIELRPAPDPSSQPPGMDYWGGGAQDIARASLWLASMSGTRENRFSLCHLSVDLTKGLPAGHIAKQLDQLGEFKTELRSALCERGALSAEEAKGCEVAAVVNYVDYRGDTSKPMSEALKALQPASGQKVNGQKAP